MEDDSASLCCCEYYDINYERNHILACCCNCEDLDESFESLITWHEVSDKNKTGLMMTIQDRLRIPWKGGAKQIAFDAILPVFILPVMLVVASISLWWTIFAFTTVVIFLILISNFLIRTLPHTKFFFIWSLTSLAVLYVIFEFIVIPFLEILLEENIALSILIFGFIMCVYLMKKRTKQLPKLGESEAEKGLISRSCHRLVNCSICQVRVPDKDHHCIWFDCCVGKHNQFVFVLSLLFAIGALLYSSNLTLTSVCHPFILYKSILLPDDCSEVYKLFELGLSFVSAVYSLIIACLLLIIFCQQLLFISLGITYKEWMRLPLRMRLCLGVTASRPNSKGFLRNWRAVICWNREQMHSGVIKDMERRQKRKQENIYVLQKQIDLAKQLKNEQDTEIT